METIGSTRKFDDQLTSVWFEIHSNRSFNRFCICRWYWRMRSRSSVLMHVASVKSWLCSMVRVQSCCNSSVLVEFEDTLSISRAYWTRRAMTKVELSDLVYFELTQRFDEIDFIFGQKSGNRRRSVQCGRARIDHDQLNHVQSTTNLAVDEITALACMNAMMMAKVNLQNSFSCSDDPMGKKNCLLWKPWEWAWWIFPVSFDLPKVALDVARLSNPKIDRNEVIFVAPRAVSNRRFVDHPLNELNRPFPFRRRRRIS